ncbi:response regulator [uncultured Desulfuromusa sp.]|uniref:response regulator n=1 Tax=uncultured Desulfuromusa sp. TaxID=219183 RepID=UPI002AA94381|nr:response regulator [uncultured Desulfuromusa sp.]
MKRIIIADDSATARMFIKRCLQIIGLGEAEIIEAEHGKEALTAAKAQEVDLLLTDLNMPVMDGETLVKWVLKQVRNSAISRSLLSPVPGTRQKKPNCWSLELTEF